MTDAPQVSVVCAWYDRADYLRPTLDNLLAQDHPNFEIIVVNDGSPDPRVREILDSYTDPRLRVIHTQNQGFTRAISTAITLARGPFIAIQGAGDLSLPGRLSAQAAALRAEEKAVGVACGRQNLVADGPFSGRISVAVPKQSRITRRDLIGHKGSPLNHGEIMFRRESYDRAGGYRAIFRFSQDMDLWLRITEQGDFIVLPEIYYQRLIFEAGVKGSLLKTLASMRFNRLAKACACERDIWGKDSVSIFGAESPLFRRRDSLCAADTSKAALKYLRAGLVREARFLAGLGWSEYRGPFQAAVLLIAALARRPWLLRIFTAVLKKTPYRDFTIPAPFL